jgi:hypothetical protein
MPFLRARPTGRRPELTADLAAHLDTLVRTTVDRPRSVLDVRELEGRQAPSSACQFDRRRGRGLRRGLPAAALTDTVRLRPGGSVESHGRDAVIARFAAWFADFDTVEPVADRLLIPYSAATEANCAELRQRTRKSGAECDNTSSERSR